MALIRLLRPHQWAKNVLVFLPMLAAHRLDTETIAASFAAFVVFSLVASGGYILNDLKDVEADRTHPRKRDRPIASGNVSPSAAVVVFLIVTGLGFLIGFWTLPPLFLGALAIYFLGTMTYSVWLKRVLFGDICTLAGLFTLRIIAGSLATGIVLSPWLLALSGFLFLSLAAMKRQTELAVTPDSGSDILPGRAYMGGDLNIVSIVAVVSGYNAVLVLSLYINSDTVRSFYSSPSFLWGACPILLYWISRLVLIAHRKQMHDDPVVFALKDWVSYGCGLAVLAFGCLATFA